MFEVMIECVRQVLNRCQLRIKRREVARSDSIPLLGYDLRVQVASENGDGRLVEGAFSGL